jgi:hypothetical protein
MESGTHLGAVWVGGGTLGAISLKVEVEGGGLLGFLVGVVWVVEGVRVAVLVLLSQFLSTDRRRVFVLTSRLWCDLRQECKTRGSASFLDQSTRVRREGWGGMNIPLWLRVAGA